MEEIRETFYKMDIINEKITNLVNEYLDIYNKNIRKSNEMVVSKEDIGDFLEGVIDYYENKF